MQLLKKNQKSNALSLSKGFTLIELLVVIGILAVLLSVTLIAINPARQFSQANNTKRRTDINTILNAVNQYMSDNSGTVPASITNTVQNISNGGANICAVLVPDYIAALPSDPKAANGGVAINETGCAGSYNTEYTIVKSTTNNRITVGTTITELNDPISVTR